MNNNLLVIYFNILIVLLMIPLFILNASTPMVILAVFSVFSFVINKRLDDIEELLKQRYRGD